MINTVASNHVNSDHVPSFSCLDVTRRNFGWLGTFIIPRPYYDSSHWNYFRKSSMKEVLNNFTFEYSFSNNIFSFVAMPADSVLHQRPIFFKANSSIVAILELIRGAQCLVEVIRSSGEEMWRVDAYQIPYYSRGIEGEKRTHTRFADWSWRLNKSAGDFRCLRYYCDNVSIS